MLRRCPRIVGDARGCPWMLGDARECPRMFRDVWGCPWMPRYLRPLLVVAVGHRLRLHLLKLLRRRPLAGLIQAGLRHPGPHRRAPSVTGRPHGRPLRGQAAARQHPGALRREEKRSRARRAGGTTPSPSPAPTPLPPAPPAPSPPHRVGGPRQRRAVQALARGRAHPDRPSRSSRPQSSGPGSGPPAATAGSHRLETRPRRHLLPAQRERSRNGGAGTGGAPEESPAPAPAP